MDCLKNVQGSGGGCLTVVKREIVVRMVDYSRWAEH